MKKEYLVAALVLVVIGGVFVVQTGRNQTSQKPGVVPADSIVYTNTGYSPIDLTVQAGTTVVFVNQADIPMWTASDPHPVHSDFAEFDARQGVAKGKLYEFTFEDLGIYGYHNHLSPQHIGTIKVE